MPTDSKEKTPWSNRDYEKFVYLFTFHELDAQELAVILDKDEKTCLEYSKLAYAIINEEITPEVKKQLKSNKYNFLIEQICACAKIPDPRIKIREEEERAKKQPQAQTKTEAKTEAENKTVTIDADQMARFMYVLGKMEEKLEEIEKAINANADVRTQQIQDLKSSIQCALKKKQL